MSKIEIQNLNVFYKNNSSDKNGGSGELAVNNLSCVFEDNSINVIIGYSGCGKTSLLRAIIGTIDYTGDIIVDGVDYMDIPTQDKNISYVSQQFALYPHMTIFDNIAFPLRNRGCSREEIISRVNEVASMLDITACLSRKPKHISGGQQQRAALGRAMVKNPDIYLFDEPLSNVDNLLKADARIMIKKVIKSYRKTAIYVTHDIQEAMALADKIFVMNDGKIVLSGKPKEVFNSDNEIMVSLRNAVYGEETVQ